MQVENKRLQNTACHTDYCVNRKYFSLAKINEHVYSHKPAQKEKKKHTCTSHTYSSKE